MRKHRVLLAALAVALLVPASADAQEPRPSVFVYGPQRGMLGILTEPIPEDSWNARQRLVVDIVEDSPAAKAGVMVGDTLLSVNGLAASAQVMNLPFEPGDTLTLRLRRDGREFEVTVVAAERTNRYSYSVFSPDSVDRTVSIIMDRVRMQLDTMELPRIHVRQLGDSTHTLIIVDGDTIRTPNIFRKLRTLNEDSVFHAWRLPHPDSTWVHALPDSAAFTYRMFGDSVWAGHPFDVFATTTVLGMRAVAGAELAPLNDGLAQYFGTSSGVLVLNAHEGTPAARAGLRAGDVILQVDGTAVSTVPELRREIRRADGDTVALRVLRNGSNLDLRLDRE